MIIWTCLRYFHYKFVEAATIPLLFSNLTAMPESLYAVDMLRASHKGVGRWGVARATGVSVCVWGDGSLRPAARSCCFLRLRSLLLTTRWKQAAVTYSAFLGTPRVWNIYGETLLTVFVWPGVPCRPCRNVTSLLPGYAVRLTSVGRARRSGSSFSSSRRPRRYDCDDTYVIHESDKSRTTRVRQPRKSIVEHRTPSWYRPNLLISMGHSVAVVGHCSGAVVRWADGSHGPQDLVAPIVLDVYNLSAPISIFDIHDVAITFKLRTRTITDSE